MSKSILRVFCGLLILSVIIGGSVSCSAKSEPDYADAITESALQSMSDCDYATHVALYSPEAQDTFTEGDFDTSCTQIKALIGDYIDKEFWRTQTQDGYTVVEYKANFSEEPESVTISVYFEEIDGEMYIAGFWLDSPKLRGSGGE
jgi:hypothetical protein